MKFHTIYIKHLNTMKDFNQLQTTILGDIGERFIAEFAAAKGAIPYGPLIKQSNPVDSICIKNNKFLSIEVKTKARMLYYPTTGMDKNDHETYMNFMCPVCILFVDHLEGKIYYQWINQLDKVKTTIPNNKHIYQYPLSCMKEYRDLNTEEIKELKEASRSNYN